MVTAKQRKAARRTIKKARARWTGMSHLARAFAQPQGRGRKKPGQGGGKYYRIELRPTEKFTSYRTQDVGRKGHTKRLAGKRPSGSWGTRSWLISKNDAHVTGKGQLVIDSKTTKRVLGDMRGSIKRVKADVFRAHPRKNIAEKAKPTPAMRRAQIRNIKKAQMARR